MVYIPSDYPEILNDLKQRIRESRLRASLSVNKELLMLYWQIGKTIVERQKKEGWGKAIVEHLANDLQHEFPDMKGLSSRNIWRMRGFYFAYAGEEQILAQPARKLNKTNLAQSVRESPIPFLPQVVAEIPWSHNVILMEKVKDYNERLWYAQQTIEYGWSRNVLVHQIESDLNNRQGRALTNFNRTLPKPQSELAQQLLKDPYTFDFLSLEQEAVERELEKGLVHHIKEFLLELGVGFAFVGCQYHLEVEKEDFYLDLLFYHTKLHCYVIIDLKVEAFKPEFAGKMNFYLSAVDALLRSNEDKRSIGMILCKNKKKLLVEYALQDTKKPIGVAAYKLTKSLPKNLKGSLPTIEEIEAEFKDSLHKSKTKH